MDAALLRERVNAALEKEHYVTQLQKQTSQDITLESFADCEGFPIDEQGQLQCDDMAELESLNAKLNLFFQYDSQLAGGRAQQMWPLYLVMAYPFMQGWSLADMIIALCLRAWSNRKCGKATLQYVEYFCGKANLSRAAIEQGFKGVSLDSSSNPSHNVLEGQGLRLWLLALTCAMPGALIWVGCPCSSFVVLCRSVTKRCIENFFMGDETHRCVLEGNVLADISGMVLLLSYLLQLQDGFEQPQNSVAPESACLVAVLSFIQSQRTITYHYLFGGNTLKPLQLWSSQLWMQRMKRAKPPGSVTDEQLATRGEEGAFTGIHAELYESQHYTLEFGRAIIRYWQQGQDI